MLVLHSLPLCLFSICIFIYICPSSPSFLAAMAYTLYVSLTCFPLCLANIFSSSNLSYVSISRASFLSLKHNVITLFHVFSSVLCIYASGWSHTPCIFHFCDLVPHRSDCLDSLSLPPPPSERKAAAQHSWEQCPFIPVRRTDLRDVIKWRNARESRF